MTKTTKDVLQEFSDNMARYAAPFAEVQKRIEASLAPYRAVMEKLAESQRAYQAYFDALRPSSAIFEQIAELDRQATLLERAGILPHASTPFDLLEGTSEDEEELRQSFKRFYEENWADVAGAINERVSGYDLDGEAKATLGEGLEAFERGFYRSVCRLLLPEIERVTRVELFESFLDRSKVKTVLDERGGKLSPGQLTPSGLFGLALFKRLTDHVYSSAFTEEERQRLVADPVPNRHAAVHGLVIYSTFWNALNAIFMADFAFQIINQVKIAQRAAEGAAKAKGHG